jgi:hypothetical protein
MSNRLSIAAALMGRKGGPAAARNMTPEQRVARAKKASDAALLVRSKHRKDTQCVTSPETSYPNN